MEQDSILKEVNNLFIDIFEDNTIVLKEDTTTDDVEAWDSLNHIQMITAVEKYYHIHFDLNDLLNFKNVGDLCNGIRKNMKMAS